jgi:enoyl-CoA hydratase
MSEYQYILTKIISKVGLISLNRPAAYNALSLDMMEELMGALEKFDKLDSVGAMVITGNEKAFAAGADITNMVDATEEEIRRSPFIPTFARIQKINKPVLAAVAGYCLGGGIELAMSCDLIIAADNSKFGQPEINLGVIPGAGGTQRLTRAVGKVRAMEMILNNRTLTAAEALEYGLINRIYSLEEYLPQTLNLAQEIASRSPLAVLAGKQAVNQAFESSLADGLDRERELFYGLFSSQDQKEGMKAFLEKRDPRWSGR